MQTTSLRGPRHAGPSPTHEAPSAATGPGHRGHAVRKEPAPPPGALHRGSAGPAPHTGCAGPSRPLGARTRTVLVRRQPRAGARPEVMQVLSQMRGSPAQLSKALSDLNRVMVALVQAWRQDPGRCAREMSLLLDELFGPAAHACMSDPRLPDGAASHAFYVMSAVGNALVQSQADPLVLRYVMAHRGPVGDQAGFGFDGPNGDRFLKDFIRGLFTRPDGSFAPFREFAAALACLGRDDGLEAGPRVQAQVRLAVARLIKVYRYEDQFAPALRDAFRAAAGTHSAPAQELVAFGEGFVLGVRDAFPDGADPLGYGMRKVFDISGARGGALSYCIGGVYASLVSQAESFAQARPLLALAQGLDQGLRRPPMPVGSRDLFWAQRLYHLDKADRTRPLVVSLLSLGQPGAADKWLGRLMYGQVGLAGSKLADRYKDIDALRGSPSPDDQAALLNLLGDVSTTPMGSFQRAIQTLLARPDCDVASAPVLDWLFGSVKLAPLWWGAMRDKVLREAQDLAPVPARGAAPAATGPESLDADEAGLALRWHAQGQAFDRACSLYQAYRDDLLGREFSPQEMQAHLRLIQNEKALLSDPRFLRKWPVLEGSPELASVLVEILETVSPQAARGATGEAVAAVPAAAAPGAPHALS